MVSVNKQEVYTSSIEDRISTGVQQSRFNFPLCILAYKGCFENKGEFKPYKLLRKTMVSFNDAGFEIKRSGR